MHAKCTLLLIKGGSIRVKPQPYKNKFCSMRQIFLLFRGFHIYIYEFTAHGLFSLSPANITFQSIVVFKSAACTDLASFRQLPCAIYFLLHVFIEKVSEAVVDVDKVSELVTSNGYEFAPNSLEENMQKRWDSQFVALSTDVQLLAGLHHFYCICLLCLLCIAISI